ncbi:hypothetical protein BGX27_008762 [Mortierella sp. AM989]|nr:hypothetical protein BGX27_008762 [Mortierella sp. AM989]
MSSNSLANNNAVRLGAAALVGGLVVYLIWSATSSSSTPRPPPSSSSTFTSSTATTTTTSATTTSSSRAEKKSSSRRSESKGEEEETQIQRQRQSVDIDRPLAHKAQEPSVTISSVLEEKDEEEVVIVDREAIILVAEHSHKETGSIQGKVTEVETIAVEESSTHSAESIEEENKEIDEQQLSQDAEKIESVIEAIEEQVEEQVEEQTEEQAEEQIEESEVHVEDQSTDINNQDEEIKEETYEREIDIGAPAICPPFVPQQEELEHVKEDSTEHGEELESASDISFSYINVEISETITSSSSLFLEPSMDTAAVDVATVNTHANEASTTRTSHHALNTKAAVFTPSWMPSTVSNETSFESRSNFLATPMQDTSYHWTLNSTASLSQSQSELQLNDAAQQENGRVKMKSRCRFWPNCTNKACKFTHPSLPCRDPDNCSFGDRCNFIHPKDLTRKPSRSGSKSNPSRKESRRQNQAGNTDSMSSSIDSLTSETTGNPWMRS